MAYFSFDFRDTNKQGLRDLVTSFLNQPSVSSGPRCDILSDLYSAHDEGKNQLSGGSLTECLKKMVTLPTSNLPDRRRPRWIPEHFWDPFASQKGTSAFVRTYHLSLPNLHYVSQEIDVRNILEPLTSRQVSLHDQVDRKKDIADYVRSIVYSLLVVESN